MKKKIKVLGIGNFEKYNYLILRKENYFFEWLSSFLFSHFTMHDDVMYYDSIRKNDTFVRKKKDIKKYLDVHESYNCGATRVDLFYGRNNVFMTIYASLKIRRDLMKDLDTFCDFVEYKGIWKVPRGLRK